MKKKLSKRRNFSQMIQPSMAQQSFQPQPGYGHPMMGQMGPMGGQYGPPYGMSMGAMGPMMGMGPAAPQQQRQPMAKQPSELGLAGLGSEPPSAVVMPSSQSAPIVEPLIKDQSLEDGKKHCYCYDFSFT